MKIYINNSYSVVDGFTSHEFKALRELLSYIPKSSQSYFSGKAYHQKKYLISQRGEFPTGLLPKVLALYPKTPCIDLRGPPPFEDWIFNLSLPHNPYPEQLSAVEAARASNRGIIVAPTGTGKSLIITLLIHKLQVPTLVVVPSLELKHQLTQSLTKAFGSMKHLRVENVDALDHKTPIPGIKALIIDEFHHSAAATYQKLNKYAWAPIFYRFGLTATPFRSDHNENLLLEGVLSNEVYRIRYQDAVKAKRIVPMEAYYLELPKTEVNGHTWSQVYSELVTNNEHRNQMIALLLARLTAQNKATLCLVKEIKHGQALSNLSGVLFANGQDGMSRELIASFNSEESRSLIGTVGVLGEGVDSRPAEFVLIAGLGRSKTQFMQNVGRGFRLYPGKESCKIIIFKDPSHKWTLQHYKEQCKILKEEYGVIPVRIEL